MGPLARKIWVAAAIDARLPALAVSKRGQHLAVHEQHNLCARLCSERQAYRRAGNVVLGHGHARDEERNCLSCSCRCPALW